MTTTTDYRPFTISGKTVSRQEYIAATVRSLRKRGGGGTIQPEALHGFSIGQPLDFKAIEKMGFTHPKDHKYYDIQRADPQFMQIHQGIGSAGAIGDSILVYFDTDDDGNDVIIVLDGATRTSSVAYHVAENSEAFYRVPVEVFRGSREDAAFEMLKRNLDSYRRTLTDVELMNGIMLFTKGGYNQTEIAEKLNLDGSIVSRFVKLAQQGTKKVLNALGSGLIARSTAFKLAELSADKQDENIAEALKGNRITARSVEEQTKPRSVASPVRTIGRQLDKMNKKFGEDHKEAQREIEKIRKSLERLQALEAEANEAAANAA